MREYVTGKTIRQLREDKHLTQKELADQIAVSDKAVSKWETGRGLPDITLLEPLASALEISVAELLSGECMVNRNKHSNIRHSGFYVCPVCGNIIHAMGEGAYSCCGISLPKLEAEVADDCHEIQVKAMDGDWVITMEHPMKKDHYISFFALLTTDGLQMVKLYPEQESQIRFSDTRPGTVYAYCNRHGLFKWDLKRQKSL
ncbi:helix-turn-helix domain-containing protein [Eubacterium barkeri]|uniref:Desulfoferrodoxin n=1 Tax=Eubacterium barkeri TaxID=1528 RepID=A0A1H3BEI1_EUBBA|nr:helix-turn-helix domain-containing protein [Eubacterium barkeri]SDX39804.1 Desulfoferrodoxin [Eubacterium barkeri]